MIRALLAVPFSPNYSAANSWIQSTLSWQCAGSLQHMEEVSVGKLKEKEKLGVGGRGGGLLDER